MYVSYRIFTWRHPKYICAFFIWYQNRTVFNFLITRIEKNIQVIIIIIKITLILPVISDNPEDYHIPSLHVCACIFSGVYTMQYMGRICTKSYRNIICIYPRYYEIMLNALYITLVTNSGYANPMITNASHFPGIITVDTTYCYYTIVFFCPCIFRCFKFRTSNNYTKYSI